MTVTMIYSYTSPAFLFQFYIFTDAGLSVLCFVRLGDWHAGEAQRRLGVVWRCSET
jgi:hypothetical protein